ncbi:MAG: iron-sulfur cluster repair di-iron protein [Planctomycetota bacterium]
MGEIAAGFPLATRVFARHRIDFCCHGGDPLQQVCEKKKLDVSAVLDEIEKELAEPQEDARRWDSEPLSDLIDHIVDTHHVFLREEMPRLEAMLRKVHRVHHARAPEQLDGLLSVYIAMKEELDQHMMKEEQILFPMIRQGSGEMADGPISVMLQEHDDAGEALRQIRDLTENYIVPQDACNTWRALWHGLEALEADLHQHIHLENNILFPRALAGR